jgi:hypothetical protein
MTVSPLRQSNQSTHLALVADRAEMLVDAEHDQDEFRGDARNARDEASSRMNPPNGLIATELRRT